MKSLVYSPTGVSDGMVDLRWGRQRALIAQQTGLVYQEK